MTESTIYSVKRGDVGSPLAATLRDATGAAVGLAGATVRFTMTPWGTSTPMVDRQPAAIVDAAAGTVRYVWQTADLTTPGAYEAEWEVTFAGGAVQTFPSGDYLRIYVAPDLA